MRSLLTDQQIIERIEECARLLRVEYDEFEESAFILAAAMARPAGIPQEARRENLIHVLYWAEYRLNIVGAYA